MAIDASPSLGHHRRAVVIGAGLGGLACALRLQAQGFEVTVVDQCEAPGGRAAQLRDAGFTWDMGPSLITMPWVLEETFAAAGMDLHREVDLMPLDPFYRIHWSTESEHLDFGARERMPAELAKFSARDARAFAPFLDALRPIYEQGILGAGRRAFLTPGELARFLPSMLRLGARAALLPWRGPTWPPPRPPSRPAPPPSRSPAPPPATSSTRASARRSRSTRCSSAATRSACRRSTPRSSTCSSSTGSGTPAAASTRSSRRWRARSTCAAPRGSSASPRAAGA